jgi:hypothetical protein
VRAEQNQQWQAWEVLEGAGGEVGKHRGMEMKLVAVKASSEDGWSGWSTWQQVKREIVGVASGLAH